MIECHLPTSAEFCLGILSNFQALRTMHHTPSIGPDTAVYGRFLPDNLLRISLVSQNLIQMFHQIF